MGRVTWWPLLGLLSRYPIILVKSLHLPLTHWGRVTHVWVSDLTIISSDNGLSPVRRQAIIWTNDGILLIEPLGINLSEILIEIHTISFKKMHLKLSSVKWKPFCLILNVSRSGTRFHLLVLNLQVCCSVLTKWQGTRLVVPVMATRDGVTHPFVEKRWSDYCFPPWKQDKARDHLYVCAHPMGGNLTM